MKKLEDRLPTTTEREMHIYRLRRDKSGSCPRLEQSLRLAMMSLIVAPALDKGVGRTGHHGSRDSVNAYA